MNHISDVFIDVLFQCYSADLEDGPSPPLEVKKGITSTQEAISESDHCLEAISESVCYLEAISASDHCLESISESDHCQEAISESDHCIEASSESDHCLEAFRESDHCEVGFSEYLHRHVASTKFDNCTEEEDNHNPEATTAHGEGKEGVAKTIIKCRLHR